MCASAPPSTASGITAKSKQSFKGELSSGCETERVCVAAFARRPWMLLLSVHTKAFPRSQPPVPLLALRATSPGAGESFPKGGRLPWRPPAAWLRAASSPSQSPAVTALPKGEPLAKPRALPYCQSLSLWERWHCVSNDGEGEDAIRRTAKSSSLGRAVERMRD